MIDWQDLVEAGGFFIFFFLMIGVVMGSLTFWGWVFS